MPSRWTQRPSPSAGERRRGGNSGRHRARRASPSTQPLPTSEGGGVRFGLWCGYRFLAALAFVVLLAGCGGDPGSGPVDVKWDRAACDRCRMVLSDRHHSAQIRIKESDGRTRVYLFDDIGCAVIWLEDKPWRDEPATEIWVNDWRTGDWIDARTASYLGGQETPMQYGLGAQGEPAEGALDFAAAKAHIFEVERRVNVHGAHLGAAAASERSATETAPMQDGADGGQRVAAGKVR